MKLTLSKALLVAFLSTVLPGCDRGAPTDTQKATSGQTPAGGATGQASEGSTDDRKAPARPSSK